ncbi:pilus assembly protein [Yersinia frederiksenii]|uniref:pilus assembly protein n=1 Tax=Yersinia frederiksenii TaxID=29484 RepID=UPI0005E2D034|nr:pilus assembly protein [Yersinia frederiksenii]CFR31791.1 putative tight adherance operon protein [Yersinia frederiksenii]
MKLKRILMLYKKYIAHNYKSIFLFITNKQGAILLPFILILPFFIGLIFLSFEVSHFLQKKAKLSDAIEQATLALTVENDDIPDAGQESKNRDLVSQYIHAYLPLENFSTPEIEINNYCGQFVYNAKMFMNYSAKFLAKTPITNKIKTIDIVDTAVAKKTIIHEHNEKTDVIFVVDYSESMEKKFKNNISSIKKIDVLREIFIRVNNTILRNADIQTIGFIPYSWGTKRKTIENNQTQEYCHFPFIAKEYSKKNDYFRKYIASKLREVSGLGNIEKVYDIKYADIDLFDERHSYFYDRIRTLPVDYKSEAEQLYNKIRYIYTALTQIKIIGETIDYDATIKSINSDAKYIDIPIKDIINDEICLNLSDAYSLEDYQDTNIINSMLDMTPIGGTLTSSGILYANNLFRNKNDNDKEKLMIIISDGVESYDEKYRENPGFYITKKLIDKGMCEKIKDNNIKMIFIAIDYDPEKIQDPRRYIDWKKCVGEDNYYEADNAHQLEVELMGALGVQSSNEVGRNTPK